ncbi:uncharacterized protein LOC144166966 [Haemaphysalis longicornis]
MRFGTLGRAAFTSPGQTAELLRVMRIRRVSLISGMHQLLQEKEQRGLRVVNEHLGIDYCSFVFQKACPLRKLFDDRSRYLFETGHTLRWMDEAMRLGGNPYFDPKEFMGGVADQKKTRTTTTIDLGDFVGPAWLLGIGYALGFAALVLERVVAGRRRPAAHRGRRQPLRRARDHLEGRCSGLGRKRQEPLVRVFTADMGLHETRQRRLQQF